MDNQDARPNHLTAALSVFLVALTVIKSGNVVASKVVVNDIDPLSAVFYRSLLAVVFLTLLGGLMRRAPVAPWRLGGWGWLAVVLFVANFILFYLGTALTDASRVAVIVNLQPLVVAMLAPLLFPNETVTMRKGAGLLVALAGAMCIVAPDAMTGAGPRAGDMIVFGGMVLWAAATVVEKRALERLPHDRAAVSLVTWNLGASVGALFVWMLATGWRPAGAVGAETTYALAYLAVPGTCMFVGMRWVIQRAPVSLVTSFNFLLPVWGVVLSVLLLGESLTTELVAGMCLVALGIAIVNRPAAERTPAPVTAAAPAD